jgi:hypothetical protein
MPRPPVYSARSRAVLSRSFASIPSPRGARSIRFNRASVFRPAWFSVLICPPIANPFVSNTCGLFFPLAVFSAFVPFVFNSLRTLLQNTRGVAVSGRFRDTGTGSYDGFSRGARLGDGSKRESRQIHVAAGEDYAQLWRRAIGPLRQPETCYRARLKEWSNGYS